MSNSRLNDRRIARNTALLYFRMLLLIFVQLYTVPIILKALGVEDYGIYNVVAGVVTFFSFVSNSLASGSQRFIAYEIGRGDVLHLKKVFDSTVTIYIVLAILSIIGLETLGPWFINTQMNIPCERLEDAIWVFHFSVIAFVFNLLSVPYNALIIAHERMSVFAYVSVLDSLLRLLVAIVLPYILLDKLILYSALICSVTVIIRIIYQLYCYYHFPECRHYTFVWNAYKGKELLAYSAWNMIGSVALISRQQGINIVVNLFFGPLLNAAHSIGQQLNGAVSQFINNIYVATRPQITKLYAVGNTLDMWRLVFSSSKLAFYLLMLITIPALIELEVVLKLWLHEVPAYTVAIARLMIVSILVETLVNQVIGAYQAANRIRKYQLYSSTIILLNIPVAYVLLKLNIGDQLTPYWVSVILSVLYVSAILWVAKKEIGLDLKAYLTEVLIVDVRVYVLTGVIVAMSVWNIAPSCYRLFLTVALTLLISCIVIWFVGLKPSEKSIIQDIVKRKILRK